MLLTAHGIEPLPIDIWISNYSPANDNTQTLASGYNAIAVPDTTNQRGVLIIPPKNNTTITWKLKGVTGDTGINMNPNGFALLTFDGSNMPAGNVIGITTSASFAGVRFIWF